MTTEKQKMELVQDAMMTVDTKIGIEFYKLLVVSGFLLMLQGLVIYEWPIPRLFGFGFLIMGALTVCLCIFRMNKAQAAIRSVTKEG